MAQKKQNGSINKTPKSILFATGWIAWGTLHVFVLQEAGIANLQAVTDAAVSYVLLSALCLFVMNNMRYYLPKKEKYSYTFIMALALSAVWLQLTKFALKSFFKHDDAYLLFLGQTSTLRFAIVFLMLAAFILLSLLWYTQKDKQEESEHRATTERLAREAELNKLRQQLQPHFLFNSLNSISALTGQQPEKARHMIQQLSDFLRGTLRNEGQQWVSLKEEMEYLELYLEIEKVRFGYRLQSSISTDDIALQMKLPSMLLQPLVENAIKFGLYDTIEAVQILISTSVKNGMLEVSVQNPFDELTAMPVKGTGFGLSSIQRRLFLLFGRHDLLQIKKEAQQFVVTVQIPQIT